MHLTNIQEVNLRSYSPNHLYTFPIGELTPVLDEVLLPNLTLPNCALELRHGV